MSKMNLVMVVVLSVLTFAPQLASADDAVPETKSRDTAFADSAIGSVLSLGVMAQGVVGDDPTLAAAGLVGALILPSAGEFYAGKSLTWGMGIRVAAAAAAIVSLEESHRLSFADRPGTLALGLLYENGLGTVSTVAFMTGILYDIATAGTAADEYNRKFHLHVAPTVMRTTSSGSAVGLGIGGSF
jgi:hypothetical protein